MPKNLITAVFLIAFATILSGCQSVNNFMDSFHKPRPEVAVLAPNATLPQVLEAVNSQNRQIQSLSSSQASVSAPRTPPLTAEVEYYQPDYFHLTAKTHISGKEFDMGRNPELFWFWIARNDPPGVYYCRHDQYNQSNLSQQLPIEPGWVVDALGVKPLDTNQPWQGPYATQDGNYLEIRLKENSPCGQITRQVFVDRHTGTIAAQRLYDSANTLLVDATVKRTRRDALTGVYAPQKIEIYAPKDDFRLSIDLGAFDLNKIPTSALSSWGIPQNLGAPMVNMASGNSVLQPQYPIQQTSF